MRYKIIYSIFISLILLSGCKQSTEPDNPYFYVKIEAGSSFLNDSVQVTLDNKTVLDSTITTNDALSLAWGSTWQKLTKESHILKIAVLNFSAQKDYYIGTQYDSTTVIIKFTRSSKQISFYQIEGVQYRD